MRAELPREDFVYVADSGYAPYGEREDSFVIERARVIANYLRGSEVLAVKALVLACNTATAAAVGLLRQAYPTLPIIGVEPALKPAVNLTRTGRIAVLATRGTLNSQKFKALRQSLAHQAEFICQPCDGLADAIERVDTTKTIALCEQYTSASGQFGQETGQIDTLVLGCTHYPFVAPILQKLVGSAVQLVDNGAPVAQQTRRMLTHCLNTGQAGQLALLTTGEPGALSSAVQRWLGHQTVAQTLRP